MAMLLSTIHIHTASSLHIQYVYVPGCVGKPAEVICDKHIWAHSCLAGDMGAAAVA